MCGQKKGHYLQRLRFAYGGAVQFAFSFRNETITTRKNSHHRNNWLACVRWLVIGAQGNMRNYVGCAHCALCGLNGTCVFGGIENGNWLNEDPFVPHTNK